MRLCILGLCLLWAAEASAQRVIYDAKRDTSAQQAASVAKEVTSGSLFDTMLRNVDTQAKVEVDITLAQVREQMRATLNALEWWSMKNVEPPDPLTQKGEAFIANARDCPRSLECALRALRQKQAAVLAAPAITPADLEARLKVIEDKQKTLKAALEELKKASEADQDPLIDQAFALLEDHGDDVIGYAKKIAAFGPDTGRLKGAAQALDTIAEGLDQVVSLYHAVRGIWQGRELVRVDPTSLRPPPQQTELRLLAVEQDHLKAVARIEARKQVEVGAALDRIITATNALADAQVVNVTEQIETTLKASAGQATPAGRDLLRTRLLLLLDTAAGAAQMDAAGQLAAIRLSDEERRYSIRRSAVNASTYDVTIQAAVQRLAQYWKGGIKPTELAAFVFYVTNTFSLPALAIKQE